MTALAATRDEGTAFALFMAALIAVSGYTAINAVVKAELFPRRSVRSASHYRMR